MVVKIGRCHKIGDTLYIGNIRYTVARYHFSCSEECDLYETCACTKVACQKTDRPDRTSVVYKEII